MVTRGAVKPGKVQCNWRIDARALDLARATSEELGVYSVPMLVSSILLRVLGNAKIKKIVLGGS